MSTAVTISHIPGKTESAGQIIVTTPAKIAVLSVAEKAGICMQMDDRETFSDSVYEQQTHLAERELASFIASVTELYGPAQATFAAEDWLEESDLMDSPPRSEVRDWRSVTIAASARLATRVNAIIASALERTAQ